MTGGTGTLSTDRTAGQIWSSGSLNPITTDLNAVSSGLTNFILGSDMTLGSINGTGSPGTATEIGVCNVAANSCDQWVCVVFNLYSDCATTSQDPPTSQVANEFDLLIGASGSEVSKFDGIHIKSSTGKTGVNEARDKTSSHLYFYTPTSGEKSSGFQVQVKGQINATLANSTIYCNHIFVFGI